MPLRTRRIKEDKPGYYQRAKNPKAYCLNVERHNGLFFYCTREGDHRGKHSAHIELGIPGTVDNNGEIINGRKNIEVLQVATWD
jgi:hypothetical protein